MNTKLRDIQHRTINGDIYDYYESIIDRIFASRNGNDTKFLSFDSSEPPCPIGPGQFTRLKLTDGSCSLTSFDTSFIKLRIRTTLTINYTDSNMNEFISKYDYSEIAQCLNDAPMFYIGFKSGIHAIDHYRFYCDKGRGYICEQSQAVYESAINWFAKSEEEIKGNEGCYASDIEFDDFNKAVPGVYITYKQFYDAMKGNKQIPLDFEVVIKYDDFAPLQFFRIFPNAVCGNLQLEFKINNNKNFVCVGMPLEKSLRYGLHYSCGDYEDLISNQNENLSKFYHNLNTGFRSSYFVNMGDEVRITVPRFWKIQDSNYNTEIREAICSFTVGNLILESAKSYINGYNIDQDKIDELTALFTNHKVYIPAQRIDQYSFSQTPTKTSMTCNTTQTLINCSSIAFIWPKTQNELTCSFNPMCTSLQLMIDNKTYPDKPFSTNELAHSNYILNNLMFDDIFKPNNALRNSFKYPWDIGYADNSNYMFVVSTERIDSDPFVFDGITKDNCFITLNGTFDSRSDYGRTSSKMPPIMFICQDTLWELSSEGVKYYYNDKNIIPSISNN